MSNNLGGKTTKVGIITGNKMKKTVSVLVERRVRHPLYQKIVKKKKIFLAHDEYEKCKLCDKVRIIASRPFSKQKRWLVQEIVGLSPTENKKDIKGS